MKKVQIRHEDGSWMEQLVVWQAGTTLFGGRYVDRKRSVDGFSFNRYPVIMQARPF